MRPGHIPQKFVAVPPKFVYKTQFSVTAYCQVSLLGRTGVRPSISIVYGQIQGLLRDGIGMPGP
jgi:hypothetical protein